jgi:two-component system, sensor histidine kinase and response regulator
VSSGSSPIVRLRQRWLLPVLGVVLLIVLPVIALMVGFDLRRVSVDEYGRNNLAQAIPWILLVGSLVIGILSYLVLAEFQRREVRAQRLAERMTADLLAAQTGLRTALSHAQDAAKAKDEFLAVMSHELRTPLNGVIGMTNLLLDSELPPQARDFTETARTCATGLLDIIDDILDYSKLEAGRIVLEDISFDPRDLVEEVLQIVADRAQAKGLELIGEVDPRLGARLRGDPSRLRQLLLNLVGNAVKFTERGSVTLTLRALDDNPDRVRIRFSIEDTGVGIASEHLPRIFQPFTQADGSISRRFGGTGLGLTICKRLAEAMGGLMEVSSVLGKGSVFFTDLVLIRDEPSASSSLPPELCGRLVLVIDDSPKARAASAVILSESGCEVVGASSLEEGLAMLGETLPNLIVLDAAASGDDPVGIVNQVRNQPRLADLPLVLLTTFAAQTRLDLPRTVLSSKPVRRRHLRDAARRVMGSRPGSGTQRIPRRFVNLNVLVADHRLGDLRILSGMLTELGCRVDLAGDVEEVLAAERRQPHAILFLSADLPEHGAAAAAQALKAAGCSAMLIATGETRTLPAGCDALVTSSPRTNDLTRLLAHVDAGPRQ